MPRKFLIDTDTASDDAVAILMALRWPDVQVEAITVVAGNVPLAQAVTNALYTTELCGAAVPVYPGADKPLIREYEHAQAFHGNDGMGNQHYPAPQRAPETQHGVDALIDTVRANPGITVVALGPLTNLALAVIKAPDIVTHVGRCVVMGGNACTVGNVTPAAEYNLWVDPEAARIVFHSGLPIEMVGWELCRFEAMIDAGEIDYLYGLNTPLAKFVVDCNKRAIEAFHSQTGQRAILLPDPVAMAVALDPSVCVRKSQHAVEIETISEITRGMTVVDQLGVAGDGRNRPVWKRALKHLTTVCWEIDVPRWKEMLYSVVR
jgi:purine nucleosidase